MGSALVTEGAQVAAIAVLSDQRHLLNPLMMFWD
jgi:hypothetical protein